MNPDQNQDALLVGQVLTLAKALETLDKVQGKTVAMNYEREAARLINLRASEILLLLAQTK